MPTIHLARNQQKLGSFREEEIREGLRTGRFALTDLVWRVGMEGWKPLGEMAPLWGLDAPPPLTESEGAVPAISQPLQAEEGTEPAWEQRESLGFFKAISRTVGAVLLRPTETFSRMKRAGGLADPLLYFVILSCVVGLIGLGFEFTQFGIQSQLESYQKLLSQYGGATLPQINFPKRSPMEIMGELLLIPAWCVVGAFVGSAILHLMLLLVGGAERPFETTFRVYCYVMGTGHLFNILPCCGWLIGLVWASYLLYVGVRESQGISSWKSLLAISLPGIFCCILPLVLLTAALIYHGPAPE